MARKMKDSGIEWIGEIPEGWEVVQLKRFAEVHNGREIDVEVDSTDSSAVGVYGSGGVFKYTNRAQYSGKAVLFGRKGTLGKPLYVEGQLWAVDTMYFLTYSNRLLEKFSYYQFLAFNWAPYITHTAIPSVVASEIVACYFPIPPLEEQAKIADYLDNGCASFDTILDKTRSSIEEYKKLKQAVITQAVTKGVRGEREMKDSGVEWIGEIPAEWSVQRIKTIFSIRNERNYLPLEQVNLISLYTDKGVVQHCDIEKTTGNKASNADGYKKVYSNDMIVNIILCWMGAIGRSNYAGVTSPAYDVYVPSSKIECKFYHYYFRTLGFSGDCYKNGRGIMAMRWRIYSDQFRSIKVVVPPLEEQKEIVGYLDAKCAEIDGLIAKKEQLVKELESYKKSLIYEVVTGKREV